MSFTSDPVIVVKNLRARGLEVPDSPAAVDFLRRVGAHRARTYWHPFLLERPGNPEGAPFVSGASFRHVVALCDFDKNLRALALDALGEIEIAIRASIVQTLAARDPVAHRNPQSLRDNFPQHHKWLAQHDKIARHAGKNLNAPIWESAERWTFGMLSRLFEGMKIADRRAVSQNYGDPGGSFTQKSLRVMSGVRNIAAHHERFWNNPRVTLQPPTPAPGKVSGYDPPMSEKSKPLPCAFLSLTAHFIHRVRPDADWRGRLRKLITSQFPADAPAITLAQMGFPTEWQTHPFWRPPEPTT